MRTEAFFGDKLRLARLLKGLTQKELGDKVSTSRQFIHQLETGVRNPAEDVIDAFCEILEVEKSFFNHQLGNDVKPEQCHFRKRKTTPVGLIYRVLAYSTIFEELVSYLNDILELPKPNFPTSGHEKDPHANLDIEKAAENCRKRWGLGLDTPIGDLTRALENFGVVITQFKGVSEKVDALSVNRRFPIIIRNSAKESACRLRFDLAHELGHFILHDGLETGEPPTEAEADKFASAFLFPRMAFQKEFPNMKGKRLNWDLIYSLKIRWKLSVKAIIYRAHFLGLIDAQQYRGANVLLNKTGQTKVEKYDDKITPEEPELLVKSLRLLEKEMGVTAGQIAKRLGIQPVLLNEITGIEFPSETEQKNIIPLFRRRAI